MTPKSPTLIEQIDTHYDGKLAKWKKRYRNLINRDPRSIKALHISASQLFKTYQKGNPDALAILDKVIDCTSAYQCSQILCPACRDKAQQKAIRKALAKFSNYKAKEIKFMTLLIRVEEDATKLEPLIDKFRISFKNAVRNNATALGIAKRDFKMMGAFEIDLKYVGLLTHASYKSRDLLRGLGFNTKTNKSQYLLHLHAIVGIMDDTRKNALKNVIEKSLGTQLLPYQLHFKSLHTTNTPTQNLRNMASYMFKARLQYADNIFDDNYTQKKSSYKTPFTGKVLIDYLNVVKAMGNFSGLKCDFG